MYYNEKLYILLCDVCQERITYFKNFNRIAMKNFPEEHMHLIAILKVAGDNILTDLLSKTIHKGESSASTQSEQPCYSCGYEIAHEHFTVTLCTASLGLK